MVLTHRCKMKDDIRPKKDSVNFTRLAYIPRSSISKISADLKLAAIHLQGILRLGEILDCVGFSRMTFYRVKKLYETGGRTGIVSSSRSILSQVSKLKMLAPDPN